jgi:hypothetical protein
VATTAAGTAVPPVYVNVTSGNNYQRPSLLRRIIGGLLTNWAIRIGIALFFFGLPKWLPWFLTGALWVCGGAPTDTIRDIGRSIKEAVVEGIDKAKDIKDHGKEELATLRQKLKEEADDRARKLEERLKAITDKASDVKEGIGHKVTEVKQAASVASAVASILPKPSFPSFGGRGSRLPDGIPAGSRRLANGMYILDGDGPAPPGAPARGSAEELKQLRDRERKYDAFREEAQLRTAAMAGIVGNPNPPASPPPAYTPPAVYPPPTAPSPVPLIPWQPSTIPARKSTQPYHPAYLPEGVELDKENQEFNEKMRSSAAPEPGR